MKSIQNRQCAVFMWTVYVTLNFYNIFFTFFLHLTPVSMQYSISQFPFSRLERNFNFFFFIFYFALLWWVLVLCIWMIHSTNMSSSTYTNKTNDDDDDGGWGLGMWNTNEITNKTEWKWIFFLSLSLCFVCVIVAANDEMKPFEMISYLVYLYVCLHVFLHIPYAHPFHNSVFHLCDITIFHILFQVYVVLLQYLWFLFFLFCWTREGLLSYNSHSTPDVCVWFYHDLSTLNVFFSLLNRSLFLCA